MEDTRDLFEITAFHNRIAPEPGLLAGYGALIEKYGLLVPLPDKLSIISAKHKRYATEQWEVFTPRHSPPDTLAGQLTFALKYEGVDPGVLKKLFNTVSSDKVREIVETEPTGQYTRRIWFLYEWLTGKVLDLPDIKTGNYVDVVDSKLQYEGPAVKVTRQRVRNNLPGVRDFCPMIRKTEKLERFIALKLSEKIEASISPVHRDVLVRATAFLLLKDSKASYAIEGENPPDSRMQRWGYAIGQAGKNDLTKEELLRLQKIVIEKPRFIKYGWRTQGGFVGEHDRTTGTPIPDHISAKWQDVETLVEGLIATNLKLQSPDFEAVLAATIIAFGFVFIHPFVDGNGRIHRYLVHHVLAGKRYASENLMFPVSAAILERLAEYREVLESFSSPRLELIEWQPTHDHNVEVLNDTIDLYRYFDATSMAEFLYSCVQETIDKIIPAEVDYLQKYDAFKYRIEQAFEMPDRMIALLVRFLEQGNGKLTNRAKTGEFSEMTVDEVSQIEALFCEIFQ